MNNTGYLLAGMAIGVIGTTIAFKVSDRFKKKDIKEAYAEVAVSEQPEMTEESKVIMEEMEEILKKPSTIADLEAVIEELRKNEK
jgi:predicted ATPase with chaperone activity